MYVFDFLLASSSFFFLNDYLYFFNSPLRFLFPFSLSFSHTFFLFFFPSSCSPPLTPSPNMWVILNHLFLQILQYLSIYSPRFSSTINVQVIFFMRKNKNYLICFISFTFKSSFYSYLHISILTII